MDKRTLFIASDLHLEFQKFQPHRSSLRADIVILAGDIWLGNKGIYWARKNWPDTPIIYVAGNHEFYGSSRPEALKSLQKAATETGVHFLDDDEVVIQGIRFLGATLWTDFELFGEEATEEMMDIGLKGLNDFRVIREGNDRFSPADAKGLFNASVIFLETKLQEQFDGPTVVVTHHLPSKQSVAQRFMNSPISACFASHLDHLFGKCELWVHGHTHDNFDYEVDGTRVICNPRGYYYYDGIENFVFDPDLLLEIGKGFTHRRTSNEA